MCIRLKMPGAKQKPLSSNLKYYATERSMARFGAVFARNGCLGHRVIARARTQSRCLSLRQRRAAPAPAPPRGPRGRCGPHSRWRSPRSRHRLRRHPDTSATTGSSIPRHPLHRRPPPRRRSRRSRQGSSTSTTALPADLPQGCRDLLDDAVLAQLDGVPLNAPNGGGIRPGQFGACARGANWLRPPGLGTDRLCARSRGA